MKQFKDAETLDPDEFAIEALVTDCYSGLLVLLSLKICLKDGPLSMQAATSI